MPDDNLVVPLEATGGWQLQMCTLLLIGIIFAENYIKMKEIRSRERLTFCRE